MDAKDGPDKYTAAYCIEQVRGFGHLLNGLAAEQRNQNEGIDELRKEIADLKAARSEDMAKIGELTGRLDQAAKEFSALSKKFDELKGNVKRVA